MKRMVVVLLLAAILCSCSQNGGADSKNKRTYDDLSSSMINTQSENDDGTDITDITDNKINYNIEQSINVMSNGNSVGYVIDANNSELQTLSVYYRSNIDSSLKDIDYSTRLYLIEDDTPIEFSVNGGEFQTENNISLLPDSDNYFDITFKVSEDFRVATLICIDYPSLVPEDMSNFLYGHITYSMFNSNYDSITPVESKNIDEFMVSMNTSGVFGFDIGKIPIDANSKEIAENHYLEDTVLDGSELYIKFNSGENDISYYIMLFVDGNLQKISQNGYTLYVDCENGEKSLQYPISDIESLSEGAHTISAHAIPASMKNNNPAETFDLSTPRFRVISNRGD